MNKNSLRILIFLLISLIPISAVVAQDEAQPTLPVSHRINNFGYEPQMWNNCGPATLTNALTHFGYADNQRRAQNFLKPNLDDRNVSPWQLVDFVNTQVPEIPVYATLRYGGNLDLLKTLLANDFPVIIEEGYDPPPHDLGWMGHYLLLIGYDDSVDVFMTHDSYEGPNLNYGYSHIQEFWQHFNYTFIVLYTVDRQQELNTLLGSEADEFINANNALNIAIDEASADNNDAFAWFNIGSNLVHLARLYRAGGDEAQAVLNYTNAVTAFNQARLIGLPWRMMWYQFGPYEAYYELAQSSEDAARATDLYNEVLRLANLTIDPCQSTNGICYIEETYYWAGMARLALGDPDRALTNFNTALQINPGYQAAMDARDAIIAASGS